MRMTLGAFGLLAMMTASAAAWASEGLDVDVDGPDAPLVRAAIEREITAITPPPRGRVTVHRERADVATVLFVSEDGRRRNERTLDLQSDPEEAADEIALVAASMARDEPDPPTPAPPPPPPWKAKPRTAPPGFRPRPVSVFERDLCHTLPPDVPIGADFLPFVGTSTSATARGSLRYAVLNAVGGLGAGLSGVEVGGVANIETDYGCGVQIGGVANVVTGEFRGVQIGGVANVTTGPFLGGQIGGVFNVLTAELKGLQLGGVINVATGPVTGAQIGGVVDVAADSVDGAQIGVFNVAAGPVHGVQIGVVNIAEKSDFSIGVVNINTKGRTEIELWSEVESGLLALAIKHGGDHWHSIYGVGSRLTAPAATAILGLGGHLPLGARTFLDLDAVGSSLFDFKEAKRTTALFQARPVLGWKIVDRIALIGGPSWNVLFAKKPAVDWSPGYAVSGGSSNLRMWPGVTVGVQALSD